jgi:hypothetical protein
LPFTLFFHFSKEVFEKGNFLPRYAVNYLLGAISLRAFVVMKSPPFVEPECSLLCEPEPSIGP